MVAVLLAVVDVGSVCFALDAHLLVPGHVAELDGHQGLQVVGLQQLAVVRVVLQGEAVAQAEVLDLPDLVGVLVSLCATKVNAGLECSLLTNVLRDNTTAVTAGCRLLKTYLICAVNGDQVLLCFGLQSLWKRLVVGGGLEKKERAADEETSSRAKAVTLTAVEDVVCITFICGVMNDGQSEPIQIYTRL